MKVPTQLKYGSGIAKIAITKCKFGKSSIKHVFHVSIMTDV